MPSVLDSFDLINGIESQVAVVSVGVNVGFVMKARCGRRGGQGVGRGAGCL